MRAYRRLAWLAAAATYALVVLGGVVRITGSGMGCGDDWPLCHGTLLPPPDLETWIEYTHRLAASAVSLIVLALAALGWTRRRAAPTLVAPALVAAGLLLVQILLGAVTVRLALPPATVVLHLTAAMLLLGVLVVAALRAAHDPEKDASQLGSPDPQTGPTARVVVLARWCAAGALVVVVLGGLVANLHAGSACAGFPLCNGELLPSGGARAHLHWVHRVAAFTLLGLLVATFVEARAGGAGNQRVRPLAGFALALGFVQVGVAAAMVLLALPLGLRALHLALGTLLWAVAVTLAQRAAAPVALAQHPKQAHRTRTTNPAAAGGHAVRLNASGAGARAAPDVPGRLRRHDSARNVPPRAFAGDRLEGNEEGEDRWRQ